MPEEEAKTLYDVAKERIIAGKAAKQQKKIDKADTAEIAVIPTKAKAVVFYHERLHIKYLFERLFIPATVVVLSIYLWFQFTQSNGEGVIPTEQPDIAPAEENALSQAIDKIFAALGSVFTQVIDKILSPFQGFFVSIDIGNWGFWIWFGFISWLTIRAWVAWFFAYVEVSDTGVKYHTPRSTLFALGHKFERNVPAALVKDAMESSTIVDNTIFLKTSSRVEVLLTDTTGENDSVVVACARKGKELKAAIVKLKAAQAPTPATPSA